MDSTKGYRVIVTMIESNAAMKMGAMKEHNIEELLICQKLLVTFVELYS